MIQFCLNKLKKPWSTFWFFYFVYEAWGTDISYLEVDSRLFLYSYKPEIAINSQLIGKS